jgi:uncharacterized membrane protein
MFVPSNSKPLRQSHHQYHYFHQQRRQQQSAQKQQQQQQQQQHTVQKKMTAVEEEEEEGEESSLSSSLEVEAQSQPPPPPKRGNSIVVTGEIELPVPASVAFDAWADLPRQPTWSPWLSDVSYIVPSSSSSSGSSDSAASAVVGDASSSSSSSCLNSKWTMKYLGLSFSWNSVTTRLDRPNLIMWESTSGVKNYGKVEFESLGPRQTRMRLTLTFLAPRLLTKLVGEKTALARLVDQKLTQQALVNFRQVVIQDDLLASAARRAQQQQQQRGQEPQSQ